MGAGRAAPTQPGQPRVLTPRPVFGRPGREARLYRQCGLGTAGTGRDSRPGVGLRGPQRGQVARRGVPKTRLPPSFTWRPGFGPPPEGPDFILFLEQDRGRLKGP